MLRGVACVCTASTRRPITAQLLCMEAIPMKYGFKIFTLIGLTAGLLSSSAFAGKPINDDGGYNGNGAPSGPHYNLNIIGVENAKTADMTGSNRHTIFMPLNTSGAGKPSSTNNNVQIEGQIWLTAGEWFEVCDGNGFDAAVLGDCDDINWDTEWNITDGVVSTKQGAVFALPCNTNLSGYWDSDGDGRVETNGQDDAVVLISCNETVDAGGNIIPVDESNIVPTANYQVWARALGKPGGSATVTTCATVQGELQCSLENTVLTRATGKSLFTDVTNQLTSLVVVYCWQYDIAGDCIDERTTRVALFAGDTQDWFWNYANSGLRLTQLRFYEIAQN